MKKNFFTVIGLSLGISIAACGSRTASAKEENLPSIQSEVQSNDTQILKLPENASTGRIHPNFLFPVTLCGSVGSTAKSTDGSEYQLQNGSIVVLFRS